MERPGPSPRHASEEGPVVRPFVLTGGRTQVRSDLRLETLLQADPDLDLGALRFEARRSVECCRRPTSVAELAAVLNLPLGVARVLIADLVATGALTVASSDRITTQLIERIRDRVRSL